MKVIFEDIHGDEIEVAKSDSKDSVLLSVRNSSLEFFWCGLLSAYEARKMGERLVELANEIEGEKK